MFKLIYQNIKVWLLLIILVIIISLLLVLLNYFELIHIFDSFNYSIIIMDESKQEPKIKITIVQEPFWKDVADIAGIVGETILDLIWRILNK